MASTALADPSGHNDRPAIFSRLLQEAYLHRPRTRRTKVVYVAVLSLVLFFIFFKNASPEPNLDYSFAESDVPPVTQDPEHPPILSPIIDPANKQDTQRSFPSFHLLISATRRSTELCRMVTSAMILEYPPPTLVRFEEATAVGSTEQDWTPDGINSIYEYITQTKHVREEDIVFIANDANVMFQLPPDILIRRFQNLMAENNEKLLRKYGLARVGVSGDNTDPQPVQKYMQRVLFGASKTCHPNSTSEPGCESIPQSTLPPDVYGRETDEHPDGHLTRPRWLHPGVVMGQVADLKPLLERMMDLMKHGRRDVNGAALALTQIYGQQEHAREMERRRLSNPVKEWLFKQIGISDAIKIADVQTSLERGKRYEFGIGLDYESRLFFNTLLAKDDVEWLHYDNITKTSSVQQEHGVPRETRILLPRDLAVDLPSPFSLPGYGKEESLKPPYNATIDALPDAEKYSWHNIPLMTNIHSASVPVLAHLDEDKSLRNDWWSKMWYYPWARALLRKHVRTPRAHDASQPSSLGGQRMWDMRGGRGGVWTANGDWLDWPDLCSGIEARVFGDDRGVWGQEDGGEFERPIYNQWGHLIKGKGPENVDLPQPESEQAT